MPVVTTFHTVLAGRRAQRAVMHRIVDASSKVVVMANKGSELLRSVYQVPDDKIDVIAHGIPDFAFVEPDAAKARLGFGGRSVILTFGLLSPNKGIEVMIDAMPPILKRRPDAVYVVLGATHPNLVRDQGEAYRAGLWRGCANWGSRTTLCSSTGSSIWPRCSNYRDVRRLCHALSQRGADDVGNVGLQLRPGQSGRLDALLARARTAGQWPRRPGPLRRCQGDRPRNRGLLTDDARRQAMRERAYAVSRTMTWERTPSATSSLRTCAALYQPKRLRRPHGGSGACCMRRPMRIDHFLSMCDDTGLLQHAVHSVPDRSHGYCVDDNARALLLACALNRPGEQPLSEVLTARFAAFVQHAWNPDTGRFRNFMGFDRPWLEDTGSEDSHGRTLWALGDCARNDASPSRRRWAAPFFARPCPR